MTRKKDEPKSKDELEHELEEGLEETFPASDTRYRAHGVIWGASAAVTVLCGILFLRIAYVSLPRGIAPFDRITDLFFAIPGV